MSGSQDQDGSGGLKFDMFTQIAAEQVGIDLSSIGDDMKPIEVAKLILERFEKQNGIEADES